MSYNPQNPNGQATSANSSPVVLASDYITDEYITGASTQTATVNNILPVTSGTAATDTLGYRSASVQVNSTGTAGTYIFEGSNDNVNFQAVPVYDQSILSAPPVNAAITATASHIIYTFPLPFRYLRLRIATTITGGSVQAYTAISQAPWSPTVTQVIDDLGNSVGTNTFNSLNFLEVDTSNSGTDGATYNTTNFPQIAVVGGKGSDGDAHVLLTDTTGKLETLAGTISATVSVGQKTSNTTAVQLSATSTVPTNGIIIEALAGNSATVYIGATGVTTSTGFELSPGQSMSFTANLNTLYVVGSNNTDVVCWNVV